MYVRTVLERCLNVDSESSYCAPGLWYRFDYVLIACTVAETPQSSCHEVRREPLRLYQAGGAKWAACKFTNEDSLTCMFVVRIEWTPRRGPPRHSIAATTSDRYYRRAVRYGY